jgi:hypothetical protein
MSNATVSRTFARPGSSGRRLSFNSRTCTLFLVATQGFEVECLRRETFPCVDAARAAWTEWQGTLEGEGYERRETFTR